MDSRKSFLIAITVFTFFTVIIAQEVEVDTLTVMTYNILNFDSYSTDRVANFNKIIEEVNPDILVVQELKSASGGQLFLNNVMNAGGDEYSATPFINGYDTDNQLYYRKSVIKYISTQQIHTSLRDISAYTFGCSHSGVGNILKAASQFGKPYALIGGLHGFSDFDLVKDLTLICPTHCT